MKQAVILAAGEGQRLRPFTVTKPKAMLSIADKPILGYIVEALAQCGIRDMVLVVGYQSNQVLDYIGSGEKFGVKIAYATQQQRLGAAHALYQAKDMVTDDFVVLPGDKLIEADTIRELVNSEPNTILAKKMDNPARYRIVAMEDGTVKDPVQQPAESKMCLVNTGIWVLNKKIFDYLEPNYIIGEIVNKMMSRGEKVYALETQGIWLDVVYPWDILSLNGAILPRVPAVIKGTIESGVVLRGQVMVGEGTVINPNTYIAGPVVIGKGCVIGPGVCIFPATSIADNVVVSPLCELTNCVIGSDVRVGSGAIIHDSVIDRGCVIGARFTACSDDTEIKIDSEHHTIKIGAMLGEGCTLGDSVTAEPGVTAGTFSQIKSSRLIRGRIIDRSLVV